MNAEYLALRAALVPLYGEGEARAMAFMVMEDAFGLSRTDIYAGKVRQFSEDERTRLHTMCEQLKAGVPVQYVLGQAWFAGRVFEVSPAVLIPRPETEELVTWAAAQPSCRRILDAGTGSGCIAVTLQLLLPEAEVEAWDISEQALEVAARNAARLGADIRFEQHDMLQPWAPDKVFDLIVSNPPYICERERDGMEAHVLDHEPQRALFVPDEDALLFYRALAERAAGGALRPGGRLMVEINRAYGRETVRLFERCGLTAVTLRQDEFGNDRMVCATMPGGTSVSV